MVISALEESAVETKASQDRLCAFCDHPKSDHKADREKFHNHYKTKAGDEYPIKVPTLNHKAYCHVALCTCEGFL